MKSKYDLWLVAAATLGMVACSTDDLINAITPTEPTTEKVVNGSGDAVNLSGTYTEQQNANAASAKLFAEWFPQPTRVHYDDYQRFGVSGKIGWDESDRLSILQYATDAAGKVLARTSAFTYQVANINKDNPSQSGLTVTEGEKMRWFTKEDVGGKDIAKSYFVASHPVVGTIPASGSAPGKVDYKGRINSVRLSTSSTNTYDAASNVVVDFDTPRRQVCVRNQNSIDNNPKGHVVYNPESDQFFEVGFGETANHSVNIQFRPILSAMVLRIKAPDTTKVRVDSVVLRLMKNDAYEGFAPRYEMKMTTGNGAVGVQQLTPKGLDGSDTWDPQDIVIRLWDGAANNGEGSSSQELEAGKAMMVTAFLPPYDFSANNRDGRRLQVQVFATDLKNSNVPTVVSGVISVGTKGTQRDVHYFSLPATRKLAAQVNMRAVENPGWVGGLPDDTPINRLSMPGAHISFWQVLADKGAEPKGEEIKHSTQDLSVREMLDNGIRVFDFRFAAGDATIGHETPMIATYEKAGYQYVTDQLRHPNETTLQQVADLFINWMKEKAHKNETVFLFTSRVAINNDGKADGGLSQFGAFLERLGKAKNDNGNPILLQDPFTENLTLGQVRGKIVIFARPDPGAAPENVTEDGEAGTTGSAGTRYDTDRWFLKDWDVSRGIAFLRGWHMAYEQNYTRFASDPDITYKSYKQNPTSRSGGRYWWPAQIKRSGPYTIRENNKPKVINGVHSRSGKPVGEPINEYLYALDFEVMRPGSYTFIDDKGKSHSGLSPAEFKTLIARDFFKFMGSRKDGLFVTILPYFETSKGAKGTNWWNTNVSNYGAVHSRLLKAIKGSVGRNRLGFVFLDGIPNRSNFTKVPGGWTYKVSEGYTATGEEADQRHRVLEAIDAIVLNNYMTNLPK